LVQLTAVRNTGFSRDERDESEWIADYICEVENKNSEPIMEAKLFFLISPNGWHHDGFPHKQPPPDIGRVDSGVTHQCPSGPIHIPRIDDVSGLPPRYAISVLEFRDSGGRHWLRDGEGTLHRFGA
jgi:hypothetical protein